MNLVYGISPWTNASRPGARHIDDGSGRSLCGGMGRKRVVGWEREEGEPTCQRCIGIYKRELASEMAWEKKHQDNPLSLYNHQAHLMSIGRKPTKA